MVEAPDAAAEARAIRAADEAARRIARLLAAGHTPAELGYPAELVEKEVVKREWRAWFDAYKATDAGFASQHFVPPLLPRGGAPSRSRPHAPGGRV